MSRLLALLGLPLALALLGAATVDTQAALADRATSRSTFDALPTLWWASGTDTSGQHGDGVADPGGDTASRVSWRSGVAIPRGVPVDHVAAGDGSACAIAQGRLYCWGDNTHGQLGDGSTEPSTRPVAVATAPTGGSALPDDAVVTDVTVGAGAACAVADGNVYCWGDNSAGRLGDDTLAGSTVAMAVATDGVGGSALPSGTATRVVTGGGPAGSVTPFTCAIAGGRAYCWGSRENGRLGNGVEGDIPSPVAIPVNQSWGPSAVVTDLSIGAGTACAVADGRVFCWGNSLYGTLGNGESDLLTDYTVPVAVETAPSSALPGTPLVTEVEVGATSVCAVHDGRPYCWGTNRSGQLGADLAADAEPDSTVVRRATAAALVGTGDSDLPGDGTAHHLSAAGRLDGASAWCAVVDRPAGPAAVHCWGDGGAGQLARTGASAQRVPRAVSLHPISQLPAGVDVGGVAGGEDFVILWAAS